MKIKLANAFIEFFLVVAGLTLIGFDWGGGYNAIGVFLVVFGNNFNGRNS